jgi:hypothetical protein
MIFPLRTRIRRFCSSPLANLPQTSSLTSAKALPSSSEISTELAPPGSDIARYQIHDPLAFLIEPQRLRSSEAIWQRVFAVTPFLIFLSMLSLPLSIACLYSRRIPDS